MNHELPLILQVEDREEDVYLLKRAIQRAEVQADIRAVVDGQEAIDYLSGHGRFADRQQFPLPYLILLDLKLPYKTGFDVLAWVRGQPSLRTLIVIVLSSSIDEGDLEKAYQLGANAFLVKPSDMHTLVEMCRAMRLFWLTHNQPPARSLRRKTGLQ
jgi:CheY-like chemotaxis protein